jgi:hypothetical protein
LDSILTKYDLKEKPHLVYNVDEKGINTGGVAILNGGYGWGNFSFSQFIYRLCKLGIF